MGQLGFFDLNRRYESLAEKNDPLVVIAAMVPFKLIKQIEQLFHRTRLGHDRRVDDLSAPGEIALVLQESALKQHNSREDNETIKEGETPEDWKSKPAKNRQKDKDARWTKKHERSYFGYKNHIGVDRRHKFVRRYVVSDASVYLLVAGF
jgi:IS5 family transposase